MKKEVTKKERVGPDGNNHLAVQKIITINYNQLNQLLSQITHFSDNLYGNVVAIGDKLLLQKDQFEEKIQNGIKMVASRLISPNQQEEIKQLQIKVTRLEKKVGGLIQNRA